MPLSPMAQPASLGSYYRRDRRRQRPAAILSPWMETLLRQYRPEVAALPRHRWPRYLALITAMLVTICVMVSPGLLLGRIRAAYPSEPAKARALRLCGRADPTFVRFFASERAACYAQFRGLTAGTGPYPR